METIANRLRRPGTHCELDGRTDVAGRLKAASYTARHAATIKIDFIEDPFSGMWKPVRRKTESGLIFRVDALDQIYYRKIFSLLEQRRLLGRVARVKDLIDLYALHRYHRSLERTMALFRRLPVPAGEEELVMILADLTASEVQAGIRLVPSVFTATEIVSGLKMAGNKLLRKGEGL